MLWRSGQLPSRLYKGQRLSASVFGHTQRAHSAASATCCIPPEEPLHVAVPAKTGLADMAAKQRAPQLLSVAPM